MKEAFFILVFLCISFELCAQEDTVSPTENTLVDSAQFEAEPLMNPTRHIVKLNLPSLAVTTFSFQYEFFPVNWMSLNLGYKFTPEREMVFKDKVIDLIVDENETEELNQPLEKFFEEFEFKGNAITPEVRFYLGQGFGKGFYLGPFIRFDNYKFTTVYPFSTFMDDYIIDFEGKYKAFGYGLNIGSQFPIGRHFTIDTFLGPYFSNIKIDFHSTSDYNLTDEEVEQFRNELNDFELPNGETEITLSNSSAKGKLTSDNFFGLRFGLGVGYRF